MDSLTNTYLSIMTIDDTIIMKTNYLIISLFIIITSPSIIIIDTYTSNIISDYFY